MVQEGCALEPEQAGEFGPVVYFCEGMKVAGSVRVIVGGARYVRVFVVSACVTNLTSVLRQADESITQVGRPSVPVAVGPVVRDAGRSSNIRQNNTHGRCVGPARIPNAEHVDVSRVNR